MTEHHTAAGSVPERFQDMPLSDLSAVVECITDAFLVLDSAWRYVYINREAERLLQRSRDELLGRNIWEIYPRAVGNPFHQECHKAMSERATVTFEHLSSGVGRWFENRIYPYADGISVFFHDITERKQREELGEALNRINTAANSTLDVGEMMSRVMADSMQALSMECASVILREDGMWVPKFVDGVPDELIGQRFPDDQVPLGVMTSECRDVVAVEDVMKLQVTGLSLIRRIGARSAISVPLIVRGEIIGAMVLSTRTGRTAFSDARIDFARKLSASVSLAMGNARLFGDLQAELADGERLLRRMDHLVRASQSVLGARSVEELLRTIVEAARSLTGARFSASGHGHREGIACIGVASSEPGHGPSPFPRTVAEFCGEVSQAIVDGNESVRLDHDELKRRATMCSLPDGRMALRGLLGAPLRQSSGDACGHIMVSDKIDGEEFSAEDEALLNQLAATASLALQHLAAREEAERRAGEAEEGRRTLDALMEFAPVGITIADAPAGTIRMVSTFGKRLTDSEDVPVEGIPVCDYPENWDVCRAEDISRPEPAELPVMRAMNAGEVVQNEEWVIVDQRGRQIPLLINAGPIRDKSGLITGSIVVWRDMSNIKKIRDDLKEAFEREKHFAEVLQKALAPRKTSVGAGYRTASKYVTAYAGQEIGGDFYDVFATSYGKVAIVIGDVSGKGLEAAALAAGTRSTIRAFAYEEPSPGRALTRANVVLHPQHPWGSFVTISLTVIDLPTGRMTYASAGHPPAAIHRVSGDVEFQEIGCPPFGLAADTQFEEHEAVILPGDKVVFYTDGVSEARRGPMLFGTEGIERVLSERGCLEPDDLIEELLAAAGDWADGYLKDDAAIIVVERDGSMVRRGG